MGSNSPCQRVHWPWVCRSPYSSEVCLPSNAIANVLICQLAMMGPLEELESESFIWYVIVSRGR